MCKGLVTIASLDLGQAKLAHNLLTEAGIQSTIIDEMLVPGDWFLSGPISAAKVQVWEEDADRAAGVLEEKLGAAEPTGVKSFTSEAEAAPAEDPVDARQRPETPIDPVAEAIVRENDAQWALGAALIGLAIPFATLYAIVMIMQASSGPGELSRRGKNNVRAAVAVIFTHTMSIVLVAYLLRRWGHL